MEDRKYYRNRIIKTAACAAAAAAIAAISVGTGADAGFVGRLLPAIMLAGVPCGWSIISKLFGRWIITSFTGTLTMLACKLILSALIGLVAVPVSLVYNIVKLAGCKESEA